MCIRDRADDLTTRILTVTGQVIFEQQIKVPGGNANWLVTPQNTLSPGVYFMQVETSRGIMVRKVVKQ